MTPLSEWENFYIIVGPSAGALTGLTFVVITLIPQTRSHDSGRGVSAFTTPTIVQFGMVLLVSALLSAPWPALTPLALLLGLCGLAGVLYTAIVVRRQRRVDDYTPVLEDWLWYGGFPLVAYAALVVAALLLPGRPDPALFVIGGALLLLLFIAIRNAWDIITFIALERIPPANGEQGEKDKEHPSAG